MLAAVVVTVCYGHGLLIFRWILGFGGFGREILRRPRLFQLPLLSGADDTKRYFTSPHAPWASDSLAARFPRPTGDDDLLALADVAWYHII